MEAIDRMVSVLKPDSWKGYTVGDNTNKHLSRHPYRLDDEKLMYPAYEKFVKSGIRNVCIHKGLFSESTAKQFPDLAAYADVRDVGKAAKDWPQLNFIVYHSGYRTGRTSDTWSQFEKTGRIEWVTDTGGDSGQVRRLQRLRRPGTDLRADHHRRAQSHRRHARATDQGHGRGPHLLGQPTPSGPARRNGKSRRCAASRFPTICARGTASPPSGLPTAR